MMTHPLHRRLAAAFVLLVAGLADAGAENDSLDPADAAAIRQVIESQIAAFARDDGEEAFSYASPGIRELFGTVENFMAMVRGGYQAVYRPREVRFQDTVPLPGGHAAQRLVVVGPDGRVVVAFYRMERQSDGSWRIGGVQLLPLPERAT
ncbi:MAG: DUF4864 domain-containing protein [Alphaproteobacteria bacterium]